VSYKHFLFIIYHVYKFYLSKEMPNFIAGFDIDNQEDLGKPLIEFVSQLQSLSNGGARLLLHAGETSKYLLFCFSLTSFN